MSKKLEHAQADIKYLNDDKYGQNRSSVLSLVERRVSHEHQIEELQNKLACFEQSYRLLVISCYISSAINHARIGPSRAIRDLSDLDEHLQPAEEKMKVSEVGSNG